MKAMLAGLRGRCSSAFMPFAFPFSSLARDDAAAFERIVRARRAASSFDPCREISDDVMSSIVRSTSLAPSSFNLNPWRCVLVKNKEVRDDLAFCMSGYNVARVQQAPVVAVFLAQCAPTESIDRLIDEECKRGVREDALSKLYFETSFLAAEKPVPLAMKQTVSATFAQMTQVPSISATQAWAFKNTMPAAQTYMLAAASHGVSTCPMEGLDEVRVRELLNAPETYSVPVIIATGYEGGIKPKSQWRFSEREMFNEDSF